METKQITIIFTDGTTASFTKALSWTDYGRYIKFYFAVDDIVDDCSYKKEEITAICKGIIDTYYIEKELNTRY